MNRILFVAGLFLVSATAATADSIKATVGHMCCGGCKAAAMKGVQAIAWAENSTIDGLTLTVVSKAGMKADVVSLVEALSKCGFPAKEINVSGPVTLTVAHLCCGQCVADLKTNLAGVRSQVLDKDNIKVDLATKTCTLQPVAGKELNLVALLRQLQTTGFAASSCTVNTVVASAK